MPTKLRPALNLARRLYSSNVEFIITVASFDPINPEEVLRRTQRAVALSTADWVE